MKYSLLDVLGESLWELRGRHLKPVTVAVIDSGVDSSHETLRNRVRDAREFFEQDGCVKQRPLPERSNNDEAGHGTAVSSIIAKIAPNASILDFKVLNAGFSGTGKVMLAGLQAAIDSDAKIINMSLACAAKYRDELTQLLETAYQKHKIVIASKRNIPKTNDLGFPAELSSCISVDNKTYNSPFFVEYIDEQPIEFAAHGEGVLVARNGGGYYRLTGTSFATPTVSALTALLLGKYPDLELYEIKSILKHHSQQGTYETPACANPLEVADASAAKHKGDVGVFCPKCRVYLKVHEAFSFARCSQCKHVFPMMAGLSRPLYNEVMYQLSTFLPRKYVYHAKVHTQEVVANVVAFLRHYPKMTNANRKCLLTAALLHDYGYVTQYDDNERIAADYAGKLLPDHGYSAREIALVQRLILATAMPVKPKTQLERILCDADVAHIGTEQYWMKGHLLRQEWKAVGKSVNEEEWCANEVQFLKKHRFFQQWLEAERKDTRQKAIDKLMELSENERQGDL